MFTWGGGRRIGQFRNGLTGSETAVSHTGSISNSDTGSISNDISNGTSDTGDISNGILT